MNASPPAGWYEDPNNELLIRYWDGTKWGAETHPRQDLQESSERPSFIPSPAYESTSEIDNEEAGFGAKLNRYRQEAGQKKALKQYEQAISETERLLNLGRNELSTQNQQIIESKKLLIDLQKQTHFQGDLQQLQNELEVVREQLHDTNETLELQEVGFYQNNYNFITSEEYQERLKQVRERQKNLIKGKEAVVCSTNWTVNGSLNEGKRMVKAYSNIVLRAFNGECDSYIAKVSYQNIGTYEKRMNTSFEKINKWSSLTQCTITQYFLSLKLEELGLTHEYKLKKQEEKEEQQRIREQMREEDKARQEIIKAEKEAEKEAREYEKELRIAHKSLELAKSKGEIERQQQVINDLETKLLTAETAKERAISRAQLTKSGHVYIISNVGSFGEHVYKIGMTRRLVPEERVHELGDASVPFPFDIHALIYSENAPSLETMLHRHFESRKINLVNTRREFFKTSIEDIESALFSIQQSHPELKVSFNLTKMVNAEQYYRSMAIRKTQTSSAQTKSAV